MNVYADELPQKVLKEVFGYDNFRNLQEIIISNVLAKKDTLALMPTGGGKSLCYQIPALIFPGLTVVVSPLISLMQDQVDGLLSAGVNAVFLNSTVEWAKYIEAMNAIRRGEVKILFVSPESLVSSTIQELLHDERVTLSCITIDEAHCVSEWGHDFRPEFLEIASVRRQFPEAVCLALTATATYQVRQDIIENLALKNPDILVSSFDRPNIFLNVKQKNDSFSQITGCIRRHWDESGIIYCFSRKQVDSLTQKLLDAGYSALNYHGGLSDEERKDHQNKFIRDQVQIMVATLAFGMGINKPNVRFVIHNDLPKSLEQYYQEIGRAGRDGLPCEALLLFSRGDMFKIRHFFSDSSDPQKSENLLQSMIFYASSDVCRRKSLLAYFGEKYEPVQKDDFCCDVCSSKDRPLKDFTVQVQKLMSCIIRTESHFGTHYVVDILLGSKAKKILENSHDKLSTWGIGKELTKKQWVELSEVLVQKNYLAKSSEFQILSITDYGLKVLRNREKIFLPVFKSLSENFDGKNDFSAMHTEAQMQGFASEKDSGGLMFPKQKRSKSSSKKIDFSTLNSTEEVKKIQAIKKWRKKRADEMNVPPYIIFGDKTLMDIVEKNPSTMEELLDCYGIGTQKAESFGKELLNFIAEL